MPRGLGMKMPELPKLRDRSKTKKKDKLLKVYPFLLFDNEYHYSAVSSVVEVASAAGASGSFAS